MIAWFLFPAAMCYSSALAPECMIAGRINYLYCQFFLQVKDDGIISRY
jgi:hypothetical protein